MKWTFYIGWGKNAGFFIDSTKIIKRIVIGKLVIALVFIDLEYVVESIVLFNDQLKEKLEKIEESIEQEKNKKRQ